MADELDRDAALRAVLERNARAFEHHTIAFSTYEQTIAESMARSDAVHERNTAAFERYASAQGHTVAALKAIKVSLDEMNADIVAQREGFMRLIDRLDEGGPQQA